MVAHFTHRTPLNVWRKHGCAVCGAEFSYLDDSEAVGSGILPWTARWHARRAAARAAREGSQKRPCPECGIVQPEMKAHAAREGHRRARFWTAFAVLIGAALTLSDAGGPRVASAWAFGALLFAAAVHWVVARRAEGPTVAGEASIDEPPKIAAGPTRDATAAALPRASKAPLALLVAAACLVPLPDGYCVLNRLPMNDGFSPPVAGPRDEARFEFTEKVVGDAPGWSGEPFVLLLNPDEVGASGPRDENGALPLPCDSERRAPAGRIEIRDSERGKARPVHLTFSVPHDAAEGSTLRLVCLLDVLRPIFEGDTYQLEPVERIETPTLRLGPPDAGARFQFLRHFGLGAAAFLYFVGVALLRASARRIMRSRASAVVSEAGERA